MMLTVGREQQGYVDSRPPLNLATRGGARPRHRTWPPSSNASEGGPFSRSLAMQSTGKQLRRIVSAASDWTAAQAWRAAKQPPSPAMNSRRRIHPSQYWR